MHLHLLLKQLKQLDINTTTILNTELNQRIEDALSQLRPYLEADNGNVRFIELTDDMIVRLKLEGACSSCSMSMMTLKAGIEQSLLKAIPEIKGVEAVRED
jgi:Fe-S cluster biogenesis protein NfuA